MIYHCVSGCGLDQPVVDRRAPSPKSSDKLTLCDPIPPNLLDDVTKPTSPIKMQSPDRADAPALVFADDELCVERQPMKPYVRAAGTPTPKSLIMSPARPPTISPTAAAAARRLEKCRFPLGTPPKQPEIPDKCKRLAKVHCKPEVIECPPLYDEFTQPPTETCEEYITKPIRLPPLRTDLDFVLDTENTLFAI